MRAAVMATADPQALRAPWCAWALLGVPPLLACGWVALLREAGGLPVALLQWPALAVLLLVAPVVEETLFRAGLQEWLQRRLPAAQALLLASLCFALCHALRQHSWLGLATVLPSLVLGWVYQARGLAAAGACHAWFNLCFVAALYALR